MGIPDTGDTAWMLASSALVLLMTPGLAFFYGGMVRAKSVLNMLMMSISAMGVVTVLWVLYGYSLSFGNDVANLFGDPTQYWGLKGLIGGNAAAAVAADPSTGTAAVDAVNIPLAGTIPQLVFVMFQLMFAIITVALISGSIADRAKFWSWTVFVVLWSTIVYFPVAHWVFAFDGFAAEQRFFLGWAQVWGANQRPEAARLQTKTNPHPLGRFRGNGPLSNLAIFAEAFGCKKGDAMVRDKACKIW